jgi:hypothetical protein
MATFYSDGLDQSAQASKIHEGTTSTELLFEACKKRHERTTPTEIEEIRCDPKSASCANARLEISCRAPWWAQERRASQD